MKALSYMVKGLSPRNCLTFILVFNLLDSLGHEHFEFHLVDENWEKEADNSFIT